MSKTPTPTIAMEGQKPLFRDDSNVIHGFFTDLAMRHAEDPAALEAYGQDVTLAKRLQPMRGVAAGDGCDQPPETTYILKKDGAYYVYLYSSELWSDWWDTNLTAFTQWVTSLTAEDRVYFYQSGRIPYLPMTLQILVTLDVLCKAHKIFVLDHVVETPLFMLVCNEIEIEPTGGITFNNCIDLDNSNKQSQMLRPYQRELLMRAVGRAMLTEEEVDKIVNDDAIIFKTARELHEDPAV